jgi:hypothetical protein
MIFRQLFFRQDRRRCARLPLTENNRKKKKKKIKMGENSIRDSDVYMRKAEEYEEEEVGA